MTIWADLGAAAVVAISVNLRHVSPLTAHIGGSCIFPSGWWLSFRGWMNQGSPAREGASGPDRALGDGVVLLPRAPRHDPPLGTSWESIYGSSLMISPHLRNGCKVDLDPLTDCLALCCATGGQFGRGTGPVVDEMSPAWRSEGRGGEPDLLSCRLPHAHGGAQESRGGKQKHGLQNL